MSGARDIGNTIELNEVVVGGYQGTYTPSGEYGPYSPDGIGLTISGSVDYNFTTPLCEEFLMKSCANVSDFAQFFFI